MNFLNYFGRNLESAKLLILIFLMILVFSKSILTALNRRFARASLLLFSAIFIIMLPLVVLEYSSPLTLPVKMIFKESNVVKFRNQVLTGSTGIIRTVVMSGKSTSINLVVDKKPERVILEFGELPSDLEMKVASDVLLEGTKNSVEVVKEPVIGTTPYRLEFNLDKNLLIKSARIGAEPQDLKTDKGYIETLEISAGEKPEKKTANFLIPKKGRIKKVLIKEGIPFVPSFLIAFVVTWIFGNLLLILFKM